MKKKSISTLLCIFSKRQYMEKSGQISIMCLNKENKNELSLLTGTYSAIDDTSLLSSSLN